MCIPRSYNFIRIAAIFLSFGLISGSCRRADAQTPPVPLGYDLEIPQDCLDVYLSYYWPWDYVYQLGGGDDRPTDFENPNPNPGNVSSPMTVYFNTDFCSGNGQPFIHDETDSAPDNYRWHWFMPTKGEAGEGWEDILNATINGPDTLEQGLHVYQARQLPLFPGNIDPGTAGNWAQFVLTGPFAGWYCPNVFVYVEDKNPGQMSISVAKFYFTLSVGTN